MKTLPMLLPMLLLMLASGCSSTPEHPEPGYPSMTLPPAAQRAQGEAVDPGLVAANNGMGLALFNQVGAAQPSGKNVFLSPLSVALCLEMIYGGSAGSTTTAMAQALEVGSLTPQAVAGGNAALLASLASADPQVELVSAQSLWARQGLLPTFLAMEANDYAAQVSAMPATVAPVNAWVAQETRGLIPQLLDPSLDLSSIQALLANAMYFKGTWASPFDPAATAPADFTRADGSVVSCPMMVQTMPASWNTTATFTMARLPYGNGRYGLVLVLPAPGVSLDAVAAGFTAQSWQAATASLTQGQPIVHLPKFKSSWAGDLAAALTALGMGIAFDPEHADFSALSSVPLWIGFIQHGAAVEVDEAGTTAAAATAGGMAGAVLYPGELVFDHPFLYAVQDAATGEILFLGRMVDPTAH